MLKSKFLRRASFIACLSLLASVPVFAGIGQTQNNMNMQFVQNGQLQNMQNGQMQDNQQLSTAAQFMINKGILKGNSGGDYAMSGHVKRGDMSLMLTRAFNLNTGSSGGSNFSDVAQGSYYYDAVNAMRQLGIAQGDGQNFRPSSNMTLEEAILFVQRALDAAGIDYSDVELEDLFEGRSLSDYATREDVSSILYAVLGEDYLDEILPETADTIEYETGEDTAVTFDGDDFNEICEDVTDESLNYIKFTLPSSSYGKLYYGYDSEDDYDGKVTSSGKYYYDDDDGTAVSEISFLPADDYTGTVKIKYTGVNEDGDTFTGTIKIVVE
jgi:hypothetical protein